MNATQNLQYPYKLSFDRSQRSMAKVSHVKEKLIYKVNALKVKVTMLFSFWFSFNVVENCYTLLLMMGTSDKAFCLHL